MIAALAAVAALIALLVLLLAVPVDLSFSARGAEPVEAQVGVRWLFGLVRLRLRWPRARPPRSPAAGKARQSAPPRQRGSKRFVEVLRDDAFRNRLLRLFDDLRHALRVDELMLHVRLGLGDPADTGRLWALVWPIAGWAASLQRVNVRIEPDFVDGGLGFETRGRVGLVPLRLLALVAVFALSRPSMRAWRTLAEGRA